MRETQERTINGATYKSNQIPGRQAARVGVRIVKLFGPGIASLAGVETVSSEQLGKLAGEAAQRIAMMLDEDTGLKLIRDILQETWRIDPDTHQRQELKEDAIFDDVFRGGVVELVKVTAFALEVNNFFGQRGIGPLMERVQAMASRMPIAPSVQP